MAEGGRGWQRPVETGRGFTTLSQTYSDLRSAENKHDFRSYVSFTDLHFALLYVVVSISTYIFQVV